MGIRSPCEAAWKRDLALAAFIALIFLAMRSVFLGGTIGADDPHST
jgi:small basic protein